MKSAKPPGRKGFCLYIPLSLLAVILLAALASFLSNLNLPQRSTSPDQLTEVEKARLSEALHLRRSLGDAAWPGWSQADIPLIVYNEKYAFLAGYASPPAGWLKFPSLEQRGGAWEVVPGSLFQGQPYYRTPIASSQETPQAFTVLVGDRWVASFMTREYSQVEFYRGFRQGLPPIIADIVPSRLVWALLMGKSEMQIAALEHESFHALEGMLAKSTLAQSESMYDVEADYPFDKMEQAWYQEMDVLVQAAQASTEAEARSLARQFLQLRLARRAGLSAAQVQLEQLREWEEGLAKYAELEITRQAGVGGGYQSVAGLSLDTEFHGYQGQQQFWSEQLREAANRNLSGDNRFYYSGNALAVLLDRLMPGWKTRALPGGEYLDTLLTEAVN